MADLAENTRRKAQSKKPLMISPLALEAVRRIDQLFEIERAINGQSPERRRAVRQELSAPLVANLEAWMREQRAKLSRGNDVAKAMDYMLKRWIAFTRFLEDGRICLSNNAAERGVRGIAISGSFCPCWARGRSSLSLASVFWVPSSLRVQRRARAWPHRPAGRCARRCHYRPGLDDRSCRLRRDGAGFPARILGRAA